MDDRTSHVYQTMQKQLLNEASRVACLCSGPEKTCLLLLVNSMRALVMATDPTFEPHFTKMLDKWAKENGL